MHGVQPSHQSGSDNFDVPVVSRQLPSKENAWIALRRHRLQELSWSVDVRVAMDLTQAEKFGVLQSRNHSKDAPLLGELQMILESHDVVAGLHEIFLPQLHDGVR